MTETNATPTPPQGTDPGFRRPAPFPVLAAVLIGLGALFLLRNAGLGLTDRWWTVFVLIPAGALLVGSTRFYRAAGGWTGAAVGTLIGGLLTLALWARLFFAPAWHFAGWHHAGWHGFGWHAAPFHGPFLFPLILLAVGLALVLRRSRWER